MAEPCPDPRRPKLFQVFPEARALPLHLFPAVVREVREGIPDLDHILRPLQLRDQAVRLLRHEADAVQTGVELQRDRDLSPGLSRRLVQDRELAKAAEGQEQTVFHRRLHLGVQRQAHHQNLLRQARLAKLDPLRHMGHRKAVDPAEVGEEAAQDVGIRSGYLFALEPLQAAVVLTLWHGQRQAAAAEAQTAHDVGPFAARKVVVFAYDAQIGHTAGYRLR